MTGDIVDKGITFKYFEINRMAIYLRSLRDIFSKYFNKYQNEEEQVNKIEVYVSLLYKLLIWEDPTLSTLAVIIVHMLFWYVNIKYKQNIFLYLDVVSGLYCSLNYGFTEYFS